MKFNVEIDDPDHLAGITAAREHHNNSLPPTITVGDGKDATQEPNPELLATDQEYVQYVMENAAQSYANQNADPVVQRDRAIVAKDAEISAKQAKITQLQADLAAEVAKPKA